MRLEDLKEAFGDVPLDMLKLKGRSDGMGETPPPLGAIRSLCKQRRGLVDMATSKSGLLTT